MSSDGQVKIGEILVRENYLTPDELQQIIARQKQLKDSPEHEYTPFGQICVQMGFISPDELQRILRKHNKRIRLGELLVNQGFIQEAQLQKVLEKQKSLKKRIGEILVQVKLINLEQLMNALSVQLDVPRILPSLELVDESLLEQEELSFLKKNLAIPMYRSGRQLTVVMAYPDNQALIEHFEKSYRSLISPALAPVEAIRKTLEDYEKLQSLPSLGPVSEAMAASLNQGKKKEPETALEEDYFAEIAPQRDSVSFGGARIVDEKQRKQEDQVVNFLIKNAMQDRASAVHIEPQQKHIRIRYRIDGVLHHKTDLPTHLGGPLNRRLKNLAGLDPELSDMHQRGRVEGEFHNHQLEMQLSTFPSLWGESIVLNVREKESATQERLLNLERIGFSPLYLQRYQKVLSEPGGLIILTGPARSGKTSTLYASMSYLNQQNRSIITAENPIEMPVEGTIQGAYKADTGQSYAAMIRTMLHLDPDILVVSEIDGPETMEAVADVALSGAKVITSYEAFDATGALLRLNRMGLNNYLLAASNITVLSQRLLRRLCSACKQPHMPTQEDFNRLGLVDVSPDSYPFYRTVGCEQCAQRGFTEQIAIHELLELNEAIREAILDNKPAATLRGIARTESKLVSMAEDGLYKAIEGITSVDEVKRVAFVNEYDSQTPWEAEEIHSICKGLEAEFL